MAGSWRIGAIAMIVVAACSGPAVTVTTGPTPTATAAFSPVAAIPTPSPAATATAAPTEQPTPSPSATPGPSPTAYLDWETIGYAVGAKDPVAIGSKAKVTITAPVGPTCSIKVTYPSGSSPSLPAATHPKPGTWVWSWTVKSSAGTGTATFSTTCTYAGLAKKGTGDFKIVKATVAPPDGWSISVTTATTRDKDSTAPMHFVVRILGVIPQDPETQMAELNCYHRILANGAPPDAWTYGLAFFAPDARVEFDVEVGPLGVGSADWVIKCENATWSPHTSHEDSGYFEIY